MIPIVRETSSPEGAPGRKLDIVFLTITFDPEPGAQHGLPLAKQLVSRGHRVKVLTTFPQYPLGRIYPGYRLRLWQRETIEGIPVLRVPIYPSHDNSALRRIATYLSFMFCASVIGVPLIGRGDVVFLYEPPPTNGVASLLMKWFRGMPIVHHIADMWPETVTSSGMVKSEVVKRIIDWTIVPFCRYLYRQASFVSVLSPGFKRLLVERNVPESKVKVIYNWADETLFRPLPRDPELARDLGFEDRFNFVYAGNLGTLQNIQSLIRAAALLKDLPAIQLVIVGTGPEEQVVRELARELALPNVRFVARQPYGDMPRINSLSDVLVVHLRDYPFLRATIPSKTQVAMACGRPILIGARGDAADLVLRAGAGLAAEPQDPESIATTMRQLYCMPRADLDAMGRRGREYYLTHLSLDRSSREIEALLERAASGGRAATLAPIR